MQITPIPYFSATTTYLSPLHNAPGLIWYHGGVNGQQNEWISAWPTKEFEYLGHQQIRIRSQLNDNPLTVNEAWIPFLENQIPELETADTDLFHGGLAGHFSYDLGLERHNIHSKHLKNDQPLAVVGRYDWAINIDHIQKQAWLIIQDACPKEILNSINTIKSDITRIKEGPNNISSSLQQWDCNMSQSQYQESFQKIKDYLIAGDCYQVNLTRQWVLKDDTLNDLSLYLKLAEDMPAPFSVFHRTNNYSLLSVSPERFISIEDNIATTQPIKGTRKRGNNAEEDKSLIYELENSSKDRAENLMIVDLLRNDLAMNAVAGSVNVEKLFEVQTLNNVHHLVSTITAQVKPNTTPLKVLFDAFPGGSITGAPKKRAMEIIDEVETVRRGVYCGCSFYLTANNKMDSNILIRSVTLNDNTLTCSGGGGIVFDSECESEYLESEIKVKKILEAISPAS